MKKNGYRVETFYLGRWVKILQDTRDFCAGYMHAKRYDAPRNAMRMIKFDGTKDTVVQELTQIDDVSIGMVAGWPAPEQYEAAAMRAMQQARRIREQKAGQRER
jgi:hypothetical protein